MALMGADAPARSHEEHLIKPLTAFRPKLFVGSLLTGLVMALLFWSWGYQKDMKVVWGNYDIMDEDGPVPLVGTKEYKVEICKTHPFLCGEEGAQIIEKDIEDGVNTVVIAACSPRANYSIFSFDPQFRNKALFVLEPFEFLVDPLERNNGI